MRTFRIIRLCIWSLVIAGCLVIGNLYLAVSHTILTTDGLAKLADNANAYQLVRDDVMLPRIKQAMSGSFTPLIPPESLQTLLDQSVSVGDMRQKSTPVLTAVQQWLDSKQPDITFSVDMSSERTRFIQALTTEVTDNLAHLPICTYRNSPEDMLNGICRTSIVSESVRQSIIDAIITAQTTAMPANFTQASIALPATIADKGRSAPDYLNMLYATALVAGAFAGLAVLWLLLVWHLRGIIALGSSAVIAGIATLILAGVLKSVHTGELDQLYQAVAQTGLAAVSSELTRYVPFAISGGTVACVLGTIGVLVWRRRHHDDESMHFSA